MNSGGPLGYGDQMNHAGDPMRSDGLMGCGGLMSFDDPMKSGGPTWEAMTR